MSSTDEPDLRPAGEREALWILGGLYTFRALGAETGDAYTLVEVLGPTGLAVPLHLHEREAEGFYVIDGEVTFVIGDERIDGTVGDFAFAPVAVPHAFRFESPEARILLLLTPGAGGHESLFRDIGEPAITNAIPPPPEAPPDLERLASIAERHGTKMLGPPPGV
ncbi:MAG: quercetin 2,3-dioxygenase [Actinomycetota bacterium]